MNTTSLVVFLVKIHAALVSRGAYKQIIGTLIDAEKYIDTSYAAIYIRAENHFAKVNGVLIIRIMNIYDLVIEDYR